MAQWAREPSAAALMDAVMWNKEPIGGPFTLVDQDGRPRTDAEFRGKLLLVMFGFTFAPIFVRSICSHCYRLDKLGPAGKSVQPVFITVDPEHDTPEAIKLYIGLFHPRLVGLTGSAKQIKRVARSYKVYYASNERSTKSDPVIDHSASSFSSVGMESTLAFSHRAHRQIA